MKQEGGTLPTSGAGLLESENTAEEEAARGLSVCERERESACVSVSMRLCVKV